MLFRSDRKSTRLNSSHTIISYAVFCLKKKTRDARRRYRTLHRSGQRQTTAARRHPMRAPPLVAPHEQHPRCPTVLIRYFFFLKDRPTPEIAPLPPHDALPV